MFRSVYVVVVCLLFFVGSVNCMDSHHAASCIDILNSTLGDVQLSYVSIDGDNSLITRKRLDSNSVVNISPNVEFTLAEEFPDFNQFAIKDGSDVVLQKIEVKFQSNLVGRICLMCSMFCPDPYYTFEGVINDSNIWLQRKSISRGGGPTVLEISQRTDKGL